MTQRKTGDSAGGWDTYIYGPQEPPYNMKKFRSKQEIRRFFEKFGEMRWNWEDFDFNPFGSKGQHEVLQMLKNKPEDKKMIPNLSHPASSNQVNQQSQQFPQLKPPVQEYPLSIPKPDLPAVPDDLVSDVEVKPDISSFLQCEIKSEF